MPLTKRFAQRAATLGVLALAVGCFNSTAPKPNSTAVDTSTPPGPIKVRSDGACLQLGELQQPTVTPDSLQAKIGDHLAAGRRETARRIIARFPDVAEELLRSCDAAKSADATVQFIAACQDSIRGDRTWQTWLQELNGPGRTYAAARVEALNNLKAGNAKKVVDANLINASYAGIARIDATRLHGQAMLMTEHPKEAAAAYAEAAKNAGSDDYQTAQCLLLLGESQRRAGQLVEGKATWTKAIETGSRLVARQEPIIDPGFWERASYLKPVDENWPALNSGEFVRLAKRTLAYSVPNANALELWLWTVVGQARMDRGEYHAALAAFKRAETMTTDSFARDGLMLAQARVLHLLGQPQPATAMLVQLADRKGSPYAPAALALLGAVKLANGASDQALSLLRKAVEGTAGDIPGRAEAEADLALAYLSVGDQANGLRWLASAQAKFQAEGETELLLRSQENEARYWDSLGRAGEAAMVRESIRAIEQR